jgi:hypothetical protein
LMGSMGLVLEEFYHHLDVYLTIRGIIVGCFCVVGYGGWDARVFQDDGGEEAGV